MPNIEAIKPEYLTAAAAVVNETGEQLVAVTVRLGLDPEHPFKVTNLMLPISSASRLHREVGAAIANPIKPQPKS